MSDLQIGVPTLFKDLVAADSTEARNTKQVRNDSTFDDIIESNDGIEVCNFEILVVEKSGDFVVKKKNPCVNKHKHWGESS